MDKKDLYIRAKLQQDKNISNQAEEIFKKFEGGIKLEEKNKKKEKRVIKINFKQAALAFSTLAVVGILGGNLYAHLNGKPNLYSAIKGLFVKEEKYISSEIEVNQTVENNGIKLTLKTVAMDENVLITKYIAEGENLEKDFYTYSEFEEEMVKHVNMSLYLSGWDVGEDYGKISDQDTITMAKNIKNKIVNAGVTEEIAIKIVNSAEKAYEQYICEQLSEEKTYSSENAKELIEEVIAMFEAEVSNNNKVFESQDALQGFGIDSISQKIDKNGNQYIIYNVYNVDTLTDLASTFKLNINISKIGNTAGTWNFETELEKARLDTRVETIDFYDTETDVYGNKNDGYIKVAVKKLVISDFSSVLMIQKNSEWFGDNSTEGLLKNTFTYVVTDENDNILGTGGTKKVELIYADRIILENVDITTKTLKVKVYSNIDNALLKTLELDIGAARNAEHIDLNQTLFNEYHQISLKYPGDWKHADIVGVKQGVELFGPQDVDGNSVLLYIDRYLLEDIENGKRNLGNPDEFKDVVKTTITVDNCTGDDYTYSYAENIKERQLRIIKDDAMYFIRYRGTLTQFERYSRTFEEILKTISFVEVEPEKSYKTFSRGTNETIKLYEDNTITISFSQEGIDIFKIMAEEFEGNFEGLLNIEPFYEYKMIDVPGNVTRVTILAASQDLYELPMIYIETSDNGLYYVDRDVFYKTGNFEIKKLEDMINLYVEAIENVENEEEYNFCVKSFNQEGSFHKALVANDIYVINPNTMEIVKYDN